MTLSLYDTKYSESVFNYLAQCPVNEDGFRPGIMCKKEIWEKALENLFTLEKPFQEKINTPNIVASGIINNKIHTGWLKPEITQQLIDKNGRLKPKPSNLPGRHRVLPIISNDYSFHVKFNPELPGMEYANSNLHHWLTGTGTPFVTIMKLLVQTNPSKIYIAQFSQTISNHNLRDIFCEQVKQQYETKKFDHKQISKKILLDILTIPEDGKPSNHVVEFIEDENGEIVMAPFSVDNDHWGVDPIVKEKLELKLQLKSLPLCCDEMMQPLDSEVVAEFCHLSPDRVLRNWLLDIKNYSTLIKHLFKDEEITYLCKRADNDEKIAIPVLFRNETLKNIYQKIYRMQQILKIKPNIHPIKLLLQVESHLLYQFFHEILKQPLLATQRFDLLTKNQYKVLKTEHCITLTTTTKTLQSILGEIPDAKKIITYGENSLENATHELNNLTVQHTNLEAIKSTLILNNNNFDHLVDVFCEEIVNSLDFSTLETVKQMNVLNSIQKHNLSFRQLIIKNCLILENKNFTRILKQFPNLINLQITNSPQIDQSALQGINFNNLEKIKFSSLVGLTTLQMTSLITGTPFKVLKKLIICGCVNLTTIAINAPNLVKASFRNNLKLTLFNLESSSLTKLTIKGSNQITDEALASSLQKVTNLTRLKLENCHSSINQELKMRAPMLACSFFGQFTQKFQQLLKNIVNNTTPAELDLSNTRPNQKQLYAITRALRYNSSTTTLNLSNNELNNNNIKPIVNLLKANPNLSSLNLSYNKIEHQGIKTIAIALTTNTHLTAFNIIGNDIRETGAFYLIEVLKNNTTILNLDWLNTNITPNLTELKNRLLEYNLKYSGNNNSNNKTPAS